jgi:hypothetical protein
MHKISTLALAIYACNSSILGANDMMLDNIIDGTNTFCDPQRLSGALGIMIQLLLL